MKIILMHPTVTGYDEIGNEIEVMYWILNEKNDCKVYAQNKMNGNLQYIDENGLEDALNDKECLIIYHHSSYWKEGEKLIKKCKGKLVIRYHNIMRSDSLKIYNKKLYRLSNKGRKQTDRLAKKLHDAVWISDSEKAAGDLQPVEKNRITVCPPFHKIEKQAGGVLDEEIMKELMYSRDINLLSAGRITPSGEYLFLLDILRSYLPNFGTNIKLRIIGEFDDSLYQYNQILNQKIMDYGLGDYVEFISGINEEALTSCYVGSDFFLCAGEQEGLCTPALKAQYLRLPVIAKDTSLISETLGTGQILLEDNVKYYAAAIHLLYHNRQYYEYIRKNGNHNFNSRFTYKKIRNDFEKILGEKLSVVL